MANWTTDELTRLAAEDELRIASYRPDGSLRPLIPIWMVVVDGTLYARSASGPQNGWFRRGLRSGTGRVETAGVARDVSFARADAGMREAVDAAYLAKYRERYPSIVEGMVSDEAAASTVLLTPLD